MGDFGLKRQLTFKFKKTENFEQTGMTDDFEKQRKAYEDYDQAVHQLVYRLETAMQPNEMVRQTKNQPIQCPEGEDPMEKLSGVLREYGRVIGDLASSKHCDDRMKGKLLKIANNLDEACKHKRDAQKVHREVIRHMRRFRPIVMADYKQKFAEFENARKNMDMVKQQVMQAKTTTEIEKRAVLYQDAVDLFDIKCNSLLQLLEELPKHRAAHANDLKNWIHAHRTYHAVMASFYK